MGLPKTLIIMGVSFVLVGLLALGAQRTPWIYSWFGRLPGDIRYEGDRTVVYAPIMSMLVVSALLSGALWVLQRVLGR